MRGDGGGRPPKEGRWTEGRKLLVAELWARGETATSVADALNQGRGHDEDRFSRNAVLSLIHRGKVGVVERTRVVTKPRDGATRTRAYRARLARPKMPATRPNYSVKALSMPKPPRQPVVKPVPANAVDLMHLAGAGCKWPVNSPRQGWHEPFMFCNGPRETVEVEPGVWRMKPYCPYHINLAYDQTPRRRA